MEEKTNVMRILDKHKIVYTKHTYDPSKAISGVEVADFLGKIITELLRLQLQFGKSGEHYVFVVPVAEELDLKKAAKAVNEKSIEMLKSKELLPLTGYIHGGCSPIGMKKQFKTVIHETAQKYDTIMFSAGKIGYQVEMNVQDLSKVIRIEFADIIKAES